jgi:hypothetical protein
MRLLEVLCGELAADGGDVEKEKVEMRLLFGAQSCSSSSKPPNQMRPGGISYSNLVVEPDCLERESRHKLGLLCRQTFHSAVVSFDIFVFEYETSLAPTGELSSVGIDRQTVVLHL